VKDHKIIQTKDLKTINAVIGYYLNAPNKVIIAGKVN